MIRRIALFVLLALLVTLPAQAQEFYYGLGLLFSSTGCSLSSGSAAPSGGNNCDVYFKSDGTIYVKTGGAWVQLSVGLVVTPAALTKVDDTNITLTLGGTPSTALLQATSITAGWTGTLASGRLNSNVVQGVTNDTNITGSISTQNLTLGWSGTLASGRLNSNVVQSVANDTNVTGSITAQALTLGWTGQLAIARGGTGLSSFTAGDLPYYATGTALSKLTLGATGYWLGSSGSAPQWNAPAALTKADDTNVTLTLGGSPTTALLNAASISAGWAGQLSMARGGTAASLTANTGGIVYSGASALAILSGTATAGQMLRSGSTAAPTWSTTVWPNTTTANRVLFSSSTSVIGDDADLTFATDTLTATKAVTPTSLTTPVVYGYGTGYPLSLGGTGIGGCSTNPPTDANCQATGITITTPFLEQRLSTDATKRTSWYLSGAITGVTSVAHLTASDQTGTGAWLPLRIEAGPTQVQGGGFHVGGNAVSDPGLGNSYVDGWMRSTSPAYASQTTGMALDFTTGSIDARYFYTDELYVKKFIADLEQALAGSQIITKSVGKLGAAFTVPAGGSISVLTMQDLPSAENMAIFESGDWVRVRTFSRAAGSLTVTDAYGTVSGYTDQVGGLQAWTFTRALGANGGTMTAGTVVAVDSLILDYGLTGNGLHEINAIDGVYGDKSPYSQVVTWSTSPIAANQTVRTRLGNLKGITGTAEYGLLAGTYGVTGSGNYIIFSDQHAEIHNVPLSLYSGSAQTLSLNPVLSSFAQATSSANTLTFSSGTGCWSGIDAGVFKWRCGDWAGNYISWNGTSLIIAGSGVITGMASDSAKLVGVDGNTVWSAAQRAALGLDTNGLPSLPHVATPSGSGLFLGSDYMGYYASGAWKTFMNSSGGFYLGGTGGALQWNGTTLTISGNIVITGGSGYANLSDKPTLGTIAALSTVTLGTNTTGNYAGSASVGGSANDTALVDGTAAATVKGNAATAYTLANAGFDANGNVKRIITGASISAGSVANGLNLTSTYLGYASGCPGACVFTVYLDSNGNFVLGDTGGAAGITWNQGAGALAIKGAVAITGGSGYANLSDKPTLGTVSALNTVTLGTDTTGNYAGSGSVGGAANDTALVGGVASSTIAGWRYSTTTYIDGGNIYTGTVTAGKITVANLAAINADLGAVTAGSVIVVNGGNTVGVSPSATNAFYAGPTGTPTFTVTPEGVLTATGASISGTLTATAGTIGGWTLGATALTATYATLSSNSGSGYMSFGATPPATYGNNVGTWIGYASGAKLSLYADASNFLQWDGAKLLVKAANFSLDSSGNIAATGGTITGATVQTAASGPRVVLDSSTLKAYTGGTTWFASFDATYGFRTLGPEIGYKGFGFFRSDGYPLDDGLSINAPVLEDPTLRLAVTKTLTLAFVEGNVITWTNALVQPPDSAVDLGDLSHQFRYIYADTYFSGGDTGLTATRTCSGGEAIRDLSVTGGIVSLATCGTPTPSPLVLALQRQVSDLTQRLAALEAQLGRRQ